MTTARVWAWRCLGIVLAVVLGMAACEAPVPSSSPMPIQSPAATPTMAPQAGGTIYVLTRNDNFTDIDPQRIVTPEDVAFFGATIHRSLVSYGYSPDYIDGTTLQPDLATDIGSPGDGGRTWTFTLRDGLMWEDGTALTCEDVAYGVSRAFATDIMGGGPTDQIQYLDIPMDDDGVSVYPGPYQASRREQALFDDAVVCDGNTVTFHLNQAVGDFNHSTTLGMSPVPNPVDHPGVDIGEGYGISNDSKPLSNGPYKVEDYSPGVGGSLTLVRNEKWSEAQDDVRKAYPDKWVVQLGLDPKRVDTRLLDPSGDDVFALAREGVQPENLSTVFADADTPNPAFDGRVVSAFDPDSQYLWVNVEKVKNAKIRQALMVALDREGMREVFGYWYGGSGYAGLHGDYADGLIKPSSGLDYAPTGIWDGFFGTTIPPSGDPELARQLLAQAGREAPRLEWNYPESEIGQLLFVVVQESLGKAGFTIVSQPSVPFSCWRPCLPYADGDFGTTRWGSVGPRASTVIAPALLTPIYDGLPPISDDAFELAVEDAIGTLDRADQARKWQALNREAVERAWIIPTFFTRSQNLAGGKVGPIYRWPAYASWPYGVMYTIP